MTWWPADFIKQIPFLTPEVQERFAMKQICDLFSATKVGSEYTYNSFLDLAEMAKTPKLTYEEFCFACREIHHIALVNLAPSRSSDCNHCGYSSGSFYLKCAVNPQKQIGAECPDFEAKT